MKVRIPFVVNVAGEWYAGGGKSAVDDPDWGFLMDCADNDSVTSDFQKGWIEVDLPVPTDLRRRKRTWGTNDGRQVGI